MIATERHYVPLAKLATINEVTLKEKEDALFLKVNIKQIKINTCASNKVKRL